MRTIWKFEIPSISDRFNLAMPVGAKALTVGMQGETLCVWAEVDTTKETVPHTFHLYATGHPIEHGEDRLTYVGTFHLKAREENFVFHLYQVVTL